MRPKVYTISPNTYTGELITYKEAMRRLEEEDLGDGVTYMMAFENSMMIDGKDYANAARFINHRSKKEFTQTILLSHSPLLN